MNTNKFLLGAALVAAMGLTACSNEEPVNNGEESVKGNVYVAVRINDAGASRASEGGYIDAVDGEHEVTSADFYFYDENGVFVSKASAWDDKNLQGPANDNVNFKSTMVVVLKDLTDAPNAAHLYPKYMVTILNQPSGFVSPNTLEDMEQALSIITANSDNGIRGKDNNFIMSTTSFRGSNTDAKYYFATELTAANFVEDVEATGYTPAEVYVERLAARVTVGFGSATGATDNGDGTYTMKLKITTAGNLNGEDNNDNIGAEEVYIQFLGWNLNAVAKNSKMVKTIDYTASNDWDSFTGFTWNNEGDHRSFWGKSYNYAASNALYPANDGENYNTTNSSYDPIWDAAWTPGGADGYPLKYTTLAAVDHAFGAANPLYCPENTNTGDVVSANGQAITSVLIKAKITSDAAGTSPLDLVRYRGVMYTKTHYLKYMLSLLQKSVPTKLNYYICLNPDAPEGTKKEYQQIDETFVKLDDTENGKVVIVPVDKVKIAEPDTYQNKFIAGNIYKMVAEDNFQLCNATEIAKFATDLLELNDTTKGGYEALAYTGGEMFYNIPIEHLATNTATAPAISEAVYGIVRNHSYQITINSVGHLGQGVFDPDKKVVVPDPTPDQSLWNVGATINILSWKIVSQSVDL